MYVNNNGHYPHVVSLTPTSGPCYNYMKYNYGARKTAWLVPHVIKYKDESEVITWRCNWGNVCESICLYAIVKNKDLIVVSPSALNSLT